MNIHSQEELGIDPMFWDDLANEQLSNFRDQEFDMDRKRMLRSLRMWGFSAREVETMELAPDEVLRVVTAWRDRVAILLSAIVILLSIITALALLLPC